MAALTLNVTDTMSISDSLPRPHCDPRYAVSIRHPYISAIANIDDIWLEPSDTIAEQWKMLHFKLRSSSDVLANATEILDIGIYSPPGSNRITYIPTNLSNPSTGNYLYRFQMPDVLITGRWYVVIKLATEGYQIVERVNFDVTD